MKNKFIDVDYTESNKKYYTIDEVADKLMVDMSKIIFWCNKFGELLRIETIGMYKIFDENDIKNLKTIRRLNLYENKNVSEIKEYFNQNTEVLLKKEKSQVDISIFNVFANIITAQNDKLNEINNNYNEMIMKQDKALELFLKVHEEISTDRDHQKEYIENLENQIKGLNEHLSTQNEITIDKLNDIQDAFNQRVDDMEKKAIDRDNQITNFFKDKQEQHKQETELNQQKKKGLFSRFFKHK